MWVAFEWGRGTMVRVEPERRTRRLASRKWTTFAWSIATIPVTGWVVAQTLTSRIDHPSGFTGSYVHALAASTFAVILLVSAVINAVVVTMREADGPRSYRWGRLGAWQVSLLALELAWLTCIVIGDPGYNAEFIFGIGIAAASCVVFAFATSKDLDAASRRFARIAARSPNVVRRDRMSKLTISVALGSVASAVLLVLFFVPLPHQDCEVTGTGATSSANSVYTSCGDFVYDAAKFSPDALLFSETPLDITTQGFQVLPPRLRIVQVEPSE